MDLSPGLMVTAFRAFTALAWNSMILRDCLLSLAAILNPFMGLLLPRWRCGRLLEGHYNLVIFHLEFPAAFDTVKMLIVLL